VDDATALADLYFGIDAGDSSVLEPFGDTTVRR